MQHSSSGMYVLLKEVFMWCAFLYNYMDILIIGLCIEKTFFFTFLAVCKKNKDPDMFL